MDVELGRQGEQYILGEDQLSSFRREGYVHLEGVLSAQEVDALEADYNRLIRREIPVEGKDYCDMSGDYERRSDDYGLINVMLPRRYHPAWRGNLLEQRAASIAGQLCGAGMQLDYDQLLAKAPGRTDAVFHWHQDLAYWVETPDPRTATIWMAMDDSTLENGCMRFVPGSNLDEQLRPHHPLHGGREQSHALICEVDQERDEVRPVPIRRGDVTVHDERVVHGSGGNHSAGWRRAYVVAFRSAETVAEERRRGFTHSHNDEPEVLDSVASDPGRRRPEQHSES